MPKKPEKPDDLSEVPWSAYPTQQEPKASHLCQYLYVSYRLDEIARDMSCVVFGTRPLPPDSGGANMREILLDRLRRWDQALPGYFATARKPPPYIVTMKMRYYTLTILLCLYHAEDKFLGIETTGTNTPESPKTLATLSKIDHGKVIGWAARTIAKLTSHQQNNYGIVHAHHFAMYAINLALFVLVNLSRPGPFDIRDPDFWSLTLSFACIARRSVVGRNLFHLFREDLRGKRQDMQLVGTLDVASGLRTLFSEDSENLEPASFHDWAEGLEKLDADERYRVRGEHSLSDMLDRYETLSLGKDDIARGRCTEG